MAMYDISKDETPVTLTRAQLYDLAQQLSIIGCGFDEPQGVRVIGNAREWMIDVLGFDPQQGEEPPEK